MTDNKSYDGPPDYRKVGRHDIFPNVSHDEVARFNYLTHFNRHLAANVLPGVKKAYENRVAPKNPKPKTRHDVRKALLKDPMFQTWSALRRATMEQRQQAGRWITIRQAEELNKKVAELTDGDERLQLKPGFKVPRYLAEVDNHCMPGSYHTELIPGDVTGPANYDIGIFCTTAGGLGRFNDGGGQAVVAWMKDNMPDFKPKRILDIGCGLGQNVLPIAAAYPDAEVIAVDAGAPSLRYGLARAKALGIDNVKFVQADAENFEDFEDESFDWIQTTMVLHETSTKAIKNIMNETKRLLKPGGVVLHVEQPQYTQDMSLYEQAIRDWDAFYNNEPFWTTMHEIDLDKAMTDAGFKVEEILHGGVSAVVDTTLFPDPGDDEIEDYGRKPAWHVIGAIRKAA
ncbi:MAG TPA: class I SAM-dependent methyltransferase [Hellea balneolensis]|uniref:Class I SAM-dependent methyltransferase n=1 Tax=Hellea balneolensis TaxID=287478 RepID=A0A7C5M214_9PROT|nr:class I SAM-dependent methyltransferase [Hellea balneolensis]